jgi:para-nitrobenzyl esterase
MHSYRWAKTLSQVGVPVWMYRFDYADSPLGAAHAMELPFVWYDGKIADAGKKQLAIEMHSAWVAFIKTGNPNTSLLPSWPNYNNNARPVMIFDKTDKVTELQEVFDDKDFPSAVFVLKSESQ